MDSQRSRDAIVGRSWGGKENQATMQWLAEVDTDWSTRLLAATVGYNCMQATRSFHAKNLFPTSEGMNEVSERANEHSRRREQSEHSGASE